MRNRPNRVVWDSCVIIDAIQKAPERWKDLEPYTRDVKEGRLQIIVSELSVAEVSHLGALDNTDIAEQTRMIKDWLENIYVVRTLVHAGVSEQARSIVQQHRIKPSDAIILATAVFYGINVLHTYEGKESGKLGSLDQRVGNPPVRIMKPNYDEGTLLENVPYL